MAAKSKDGTASVASGDVLIVLNRDPADRERWKWQVAELQQLADRTPQSVLYFLLVLPTSSPPDAALRATIQEDLRRLGPKLRKLIVVPLGDGLWVAVVRTMVRATLLLGGRAKQQIVEASIEQGLERVFEFSSPETPLRATLESSIDDLFRVLGVSRIAE